MWIYGLLKKLIDLINQEQLVSQKVILIFSIFTIYLLKNSTLLLEIPIVLDLSGRLVFFELHKSTYIFLLTNALAKAKLDKLFPSIQILILILILTTKIR